MSSKKILARFTFILMTCSSFSLAQGSEPASTSSLGGQIVLSVKGGLKKPVLVLLDHSGSKKDQRTFTDLHGNFEFRNVPKGSHYIRVRLEGFENVNYPVDVPGTPYVFIFLNGKRGPRASRSGWEACCRHPTIEGLGQAWYRLSEYAEAEQALARAALLDQDFEAAELMLLHAYVRQGKLRAALSGMDALLQKNPGNSRNPALGKFRAEVVAALANLKQGTQKQK